MLTTVQKIGKREARARYDRGEAIAMAGESWWFDAPREASTFTREDMRCSFDELHTARSGSHYSYAAPAGV